MLPAAAGGKRSRNAANPIFPAGIIPALQLANAHVGQVCYLPQLEDKIPLRATTPRLHPYCLSQS